MKILAVDDNPNILIVLQTALTMHGHEVSTLTDGEEAMFLLADPKCKYDILLLDIHLPGVSGKDILNMLDQIHRKVKVIIITGDMDCVEYGKEVLDRKNVVGFIMKPFNVSYLCKVIEEAAGDCEKCKVG